MKQAEIKSDRSSNINERKEPVLSKRISTKKKLWSPNQSTRARLPTPSTSTRPKKPKKSGIDLKEFQRCESQKQVSTLISQANNNVTSNKDTNVSEDEEIVTVSITIISIRLCPNPF